MNGRKLGYAAGVIRQESHSGQLVTYAYRTDVGKPEDGDIVRQERLIALALLGFLVIFTVCDVIEDLHEGSTFNHVAGEGLMVTICLASGIYLWRKVSGSWKSVTDQMQSQLIAVREDARRWESAHATLSRGLVDAIDAQLQDWGLSSAEKEITFLVMKGLSFKEIAEIRSTSEHTVRQQAATVYRKSGLEGRSQLTAFFLEDLLTPRQL